MRKGGNTNKNLSVEKRYNFKNHCPWRLYCLGFLKLCYSSPRGEERQNTLVRAAKDMNARKACVP